MSDEKKVNDGGPVFPETRWDDKTRQDVQWTGMTLRDWFAGQALAGIVASSEIPTEPFAITAYRIADAMLREREARR